MAHGAFERVGPGDPGVAAPDGMPMLSAGRHRGPERGSCVMEYVSVLAGEPWSDHPRCTDPALAELARRVNDDVRADTRPALAALAPGLTGAGGPRTATDVVVAAVARVGLERAPDDVVLSRVRRRALARLAREHAGAGLPRLARLRGIARVGDVYLQFGRTLRGSARAERDAARVRALTAAVEDVRRYVGTPAPPPRATVTGAESDGRRVGAVRSLDRRRSAASPRVPAQCLDEGAGTHVLRDDLEGPAAERGRGLLGGDRARVDDDTHLGRLLAQRGDQLDAPAVGEPVVHDREVRPPLEHRPVPARTGVDGCDHVEARGLEQGHEVFPHPDVVLDEDDAWARPVREPATPARRPSRCHGAILLSRPPSRRPGSPDRLGRRTG